MLLLCLSYFRISLVFFFFNDTATTEIYTLSLHDALPICLRPRAPPERPRRERDPRDLDRRDRKSTRLNSSHLVISYAVFCLKKKKKQTSFLTRDITIHVGRDDASARNHRSRRLRRRLVVS